MGCWSESCGLSGLEIREGVECYLAVLAPNGFDIDVNARNFDFVVPPIHGTYDEYGGLNLLEDYPFSPFCLKKGDNFRPKLCDALFIDASVFHFVRRLEPEMTFDPSVKTLTDIELEATHRVRVRIQQNNETKPAKRPFLPLWFDVLSRSESGGNLRDAMRLFEDYSESPLPFYGRCVLLYNAYGELRKKMVPSSCRSPQHGGAQALIPFYRHVLATAEERETSWRAENK